MANYRPIGKSIGAASAYSGTIITAKLSLSNWGMLLARGTAVRFSVSASVADSWTISVPIPSGGVAVWESTAPTTGDPSRVTFGDISGAYGITCRAGVDLKFKYYTP